MATLFGIPSYWTLVGSIKRISEILIVPPIWWLAAPQWGNCARAFELTPYGLFFTNTTTDSSASTLGQVLTASLVGYGFARYRFPGRDPLFMLVLSTLMLPPELTVVPVFFAAQRYFARGVVMSGVTG